MIRKSLVLLAVVAITAFSLTGCKEKSEPQVQSITIDQAKQAAEKEITQENLDAELEKMQNEMTAE